MEHNLDETMSPGQRALQSQLLRLIRERPNLSTFHLVDIVTLPVRVEYIRGNVAKRICHALGTMRKQGLIVNRVEHHGRYVSWRTP